MTAVARVLRQYRHHYGCEELAGKVTEVTPGEGTCSFVPCGDSRVRTVWLKHLAELRDDGIDYLALARKQGWRGQ